VRLLALGLAITVMVACDGPVQDQAPSPPASMMSSAPAAGRVDVGGYDLAYECRGTGPVTIVTEAGYDSAGTSAFIDLMDPLARIGRVCAYDRAGTGTSDPRPKAVADGLTVMDEAAELHALLQGAGIEPPYVLVGHSFGGFVSRLFATAYPDETAGLLLIESSHEDEIARYRVVYGPDSPDADWVDGGDLLDIDATANILRGPGHDLGALPLIGLRAEIYPDGLTEGLWRRTQADLTTISSDAVYAVALGSGHFVIDENRPAVLAAVQGLVTAASSGEPLDACEQIFAGAEVDCSPD
jgi:hypothetical protein